MTHGVMTLNITNLSIIGLFATLSTNDPQHNNTAIMLSVARLTVAFNLLLC
jgi:hypothetical protein